jgi:hypothetical protein
LGSFFATEGTQLVPKSKAGIILQHFPIWVRSAICGDFQPLDSTDGRKIDRHDPNDRHRYFDRFNADAKPLIPMKPPGSPLRIHAGAGRRAAIRSK